MLLVIGAAGVFELGANGTQFREATPSSSVSMTGRPIKIPAKRFEWFGSGTSSKEQIHHASSRSREDSGRQAFLSFSRSPKSANGLWVETGSRSLPAVSSPYDPATSCRECSLSWQ